MNRFNKLQIFNFSLIFGVYLLISYVPGYLGLSSHLVTIPYRFISLLVSIFVVLYGLSIGRTLNFNNYHRLIILFWVLYLLRMFIDLHVIDLNIDFQYENTILYWFYSLGVGFIPMISSLMMKDVSYLKIYKWYYRLLFLGLFISLFSNFSASQGNGIEGRSGANLSVQAVLYGNLGAYLILLAISGFKLNINKLFNYLSVLLGVIVILSSGSRGAFFSIFLILFVYYFFRGKSLKKGFLKLMSLLLIIFFLKEYIWSLLYDKIYSFSPILAVRLNISISGGDNALNGRDDLFNQGILDFINNPIFGNHFVLVETWASGFYPHNIVIEAFMALGVVGGGIFLFLVIKASLISLKLITLKDEKIWIGLLFLQNLMYGMSSMAIYKHQAMWIFMVMLFSLNLNKKRNA